METTTAPTVPSVSPVYFKKEILSSGYVANGAVVQFEVLDGNVGVLALVPGIDDALIRALNAAAAAHKGGILKISEQDYLETKKKRPFNPSAVKRPDMLKLMSASAAPMFRPKLDSPAGGSAEAAALKPLPPQRPPGAPLPAAPAFKPTVARASQRPVPAPTIQELTSPAD